MLVIYIAMLLLGSISVLWTSDSLVHVFQNTLFRSNDGALTKGTTTGSHEYIISKATCAKAQGSVLMPLDLVRGTVQDYLNRTDARQEQMFPQLGRLLLQQAVDRNETLLTLQIGGMDGRSNDPMYGMMVKDQNDQSKLQQYWWPVVVEPVMDNFQVLVETYRNISIERDLHCSTLANWAISYDSNATNEDRRTSSSTTRTCPFCRFDTSSSDAECLKQPDWVKYQLGTLDCDYSQKFFHTLRQCLVQDNVPCGDVQALFQQYVHLPPSRIAMLQIDIEGYEAFVLEGFLRELKPQDLPPIIHFEYKVMRHLDNTQHNGIANREKMLKGLLDERGYEMHEFTSGDSIALRV